MKAKGGHLTAWHRYQSHQRDHWNGSQGWTFDGIDANHTREITGMKAKGGHLTASMPITPERSLEWKPRVDIEEKRTVDIADKNKDAPTEDHVV